MAYWEAVTSKPDLVVGIPSLGNVTIDWVLNFLTLERFPNTIVRTWKGLPVDVARDSLVRDSLRMGAKHIFFLDQDQIVPQSAIYQLASEYLPIIGALYWSKRGQYACWKLAPDKRSVIPYTKEDLQPEGAPHKVETIGAGALLIDMRVFQAIPEPWFEWQIRDPKDPAGTFGEDISFGLKAARYGFCTYCLTSVRAGHEYLSVRDPEGQEMKFGEES